MPRIFGRGLFVSSAERRDDYEARTDVDIFQRSTQTLRYEQLTQEREKADRLKARKAQKRTEDDEDSSVREAKKAKVHIKEETSGSRGRQRSRSGSASSTVVKPAVATPSRKGKEKAQANIICLESSEDETHAAPVAPARASPRRSPEEADTPSSPDLQSISARTSPTRRAKKTRQPDKKQKSREARPDQSDEDGEYLRSLLKKLDECTKKAEPGDGNTPEAQDVTAAKSLPTPRSPQKPVTDASRDALDNPVMKILVSSRWEEMKSVMLLRRYEQDMKRVKGSWCDVNNIDEEKAKTMFLTWRSSKVFDSATCKVLGIQIDKDGQTYIKDKNGEPRYFEDGQVYMEMATDEIMAQDEAERAAKSRAKQLRARSETDVGNGAARPETKVANVKLILRAKGFADYKLKVKPHTKISQIIQVYQMQQAIDPSKKLSIYFEGEALDPNATVSQTELESNVVADVHIK